ncbi:MAG: twin-arginine translocation signal domain-containing protein, partial [bacterium]
MKRDNPLSDERKEEETEEKSHSGLNRRAFLKAVTAASGGAILGSAVKAYASKEFEGYPDSFGVLTDLTACVGCRSCEQACNKVNKLPAPDKPFEDGSVFKEMRRPTAKAFTVV